MVRIVIDAGDGITAPVKHSSKEDSEWVCNNKVVLAVVAKLKTYKDVEILRVDDPSGTIDIPLQTRADWANQWNADVYVSIHHNVLLDNMGEYNSVEADPMDLPEMDELSQDQYPRIVKSMEIQRGQKRENLHVFRETAIPAIVREGGLIDSVIDIIKLRDEEYLKAEGEAIAKGIATYIKLQPKSNSKIIEAASNKLTQKLYAPTAEELVEATTIVLSHLESDSEGVIPSSWLKKIQDGTLTDSDSVCLLYVVIDRWLTQDEDS